MLDDQDPLNIWNELEQINYRNFDFYKNLSDEDKKRIGLFPILTWLSSSSTGVDIQEYYIEECSKISQNWFELGKHPELQWKLLCSIGFGAKTRHNWIGHTKRLNSNKLDNLLLEYMPYLNAQELGIVKSRLDKSSLKEICKKYGFDDKETKGYLDELKKIKKET